ncbi:MAG: fluoride efflux transporter CrcB [Ignavibacteriales bacterium]|nr:MAG: fluoride efflux transporter CrcB [Ignavibacteriales bacterium]
MLKYILVSLGAAIGGALRYWLSNYVYKFLPENFPYGTLTVNVAGSFLVGFFIFYLSDREIISSNLKLFLTVGFCGGFTTFSTFSLETMNLFRDSEFLLAGFNILLNLFLCLLGVYLAYIIFKAN